jgi:hypothetical protein
MHINYKPLFQANVQGGISKNSTSPDRDPINTAKIRIVVGCKNVSAAGAQMYATNVSQPFVF